MDLYRVNLNLLIALDKLLMEQSVTIAAKKLCITQAAMSNNLQQLRVLFKDDLLVRERNGMALTHFARELQPRLHQVIQEVHSVIVSGQNFDALTSERVFKIGISEYLSALLLPKLIAYLQKHAPKIRLRITAVNLLNNIDAFEKSDFDMAIGKIFDLPAFINKKLLFTDEIVCIMNTKHSLAKKKQISMQDYVDSKHIAVRADDPSVLPVVEQELAKLGFYRDIQVSLPFIIPIYTLIEQSANLIATVIHSTTRIYGASHRYITKKLPFKLPPVEFYLAWHQRYDHDLGHVWLRNAFYEICKDL